MMLVYVFCLLIISEVEMCPAKISEIIKKGSPIIRPVENIYYVVRNVLKIFDNEEPTYHICGNTTLLDELTNIFPGFEIFAKMTEPFRTYLREDCVNCGPHHEKIHRVLRCIASDDSENMKLLETIQSEIVQIKSD